MIREASRLALGAVGACRSVGWLLAAIMMGLVAWVPAMGHAAEYAIGPVPAWVVPIQPGLSTADQLSQDSDGEAFLLTDTQIFAGDQQRVTYRRVVTTAINASGVDAVANIEIPFDPSYQHLVLHSINIVRHGRVIPKLATARIRVLQRETELEARIYDGTKTVNVFLDDVRAGDTVDYSYSTSGRNPVFKGIDFGSMALQFAVPVARIHTRLLLPVGEQVHFAARNTAITPAISEHDGMRDYVWNVVDAPVLKVEEGAPGWYEPYAQVAWSEFADWAAVARWAVPLYQVPSTLSPALQAQVDRITKNETTPAGRMLAALRLVQEDVRYLGVEIGQNSHAPNAPELVYARRFGDCKDKTLLTLTLLSHLGIDAHAALVNTNLQRGLTDVLPRPGVFDHVLVQARVDNKVWWIDPTRDTQKADLAHLVQPNYGVALIVEPDTQALTAMTRPDATSDGRRLDVKFDAGTDFDKPVRYTVETTTIGDSAERLRATLSSTNRADIQKNYLNFYAKRYPQITVAAPMEVHDDEAANRIVSKESYSIAGMSEPSDDGKGHVADIHLPDVLEALNDPAVTVRKAPLALRYPMDVSQHTDVLLPGAWSLKPSATTIKDPAFRFEQTVTLQGLHLIITDHYQALTDEVAAKDMPRYLSNLARARNIAGYELTWRDAAAAKSSGAGKASGLDRMNWPVALLALGIFGFCTWLAVTVYKYDPAPSDVRDAALVGIRGWLLVLAVVLALKPFIYVSQLKHLANVMAIDHWSNLTTYGSSAYSALWAPSLLFELVVMLGQLVFSILVLLLLFKRRSSFPRVALAALLAHIVLYLADLAIASMLPTGPDVSKDAAKAMGAIIGTAIWSTYLLQSWRVKSTFVKRYRIGVPPLPSPVAEPITTGEQAGQM